MNPLCFCCASVRRVKAVEFGRDVPFDSEWDRSQMPIRMELMDVARAIPARIVSCTVVHGERSAVRLCFRRGRSSELLSYERKATQLVVSGKKRVWRSIGRRWLECRRPKACCQWQRHRQRRRPRLSMTSMKLQISWAPSSLSCRKLLAHCEHVTASSRKLLRS